MGKLRSAIRTARITAGLSASVPRLYTVYEDGDKLQWLREGKWVDVYHVFDKESAEWSAECMKEDSPEYQQVIGLDGFIKCQSRPANVN